VTRRARPGRSGTRLEVSSPSPERTRLVGAAVARALRPGDVVVLSGELGAGKTTLVQGMAAGLGVEEQVTSPTFTLVRPYACAPPGSVANPTGLRVLLHADLYRLERTAELADLALGELVEEEAAAVVEWGEVADEALRRDSLVVELLTLPDPAGAAPPAGATQGDGRRLVTMQLPPGREDDAASLRRRLSLGPGAEASGGGARASAGG
jgi:tRNA threonylcarbamoyladenosine biosynthesis protein TsaE